MARQVTFCVSDELYERLLRTIGSRRDHPADFISDALIDYSAGPGSSATPAERREIEAAEGAIRAERMSRFTHGPIR